MNFFLRRSKWYVRAYKLGFSFNSIAIITSLSLMSTVAEMFGIGVFLPIFQFIRFEGNVSELVADSTIWQYIINIFTYFNLSPSLLILLLIAFLFLIMRQVFNYVRTLYIAATTKRLIQKQYNCLFDKYIHTNSSYQDSTPVGDLTNVFMTEADRAVGAIMAPTGLIVSIVILSGYLTLLFILSWEMTLFSSMILYLTSLVPKIWINKSEQTGRDIVSANMLVSKFLISRLSSPRLIRLAGNESEEKKEFHYLTLKQRKYQVLSAILRAKTMIIMEPIIVLLSLIFLYLSYTIIQLNIEEIGLYLVVALRLIPTVQSIMMQFQSIKGSLGSLEALENRIHTMDEAVEKDTGTKDLGEFNQSILLSNVSYQYPTGLYYALKHITVEFKKNSLTALVGPSGGGKSTLIDLLPRLRLPTKGEIYINDLNIKKYTLKSLRGSISYVPQSPQIFNGTIKEHMLYGKNDVTSEELQEAIYLAGAEDFINRLPHGVNAIINEGAINFSGGQRQRIDIARALLNKSPILILDEPTSNLDAESEDRFKQVLYRIHRNTNTTIIVVSHKLSIVSSADKIIVLNQGEVESSGTHLELLNKSDWYTKAWNFQQL